MRSVCVLIQQWLYGMFLMFEDMVDGMFLKLLENQLSEFSKYVKRLYYFN